MSKNELGDGKFIDNLYRINIDSIGLELFIDSVLFMEKFLENFTKMEEQVNIIKDSDFVLLPEHISDDLWCESPEPDLLDWVCGE